MLKAGEIVFVTLTLESGEKGTLRMERDKDRPDRVAFGIFDWPLLYMGRSNRPPPIAAGWMTLLAARDLSRALATAAKELSC